MALTNLVKAKIVTYQHKILPSNISVNTADIAGLKFNNLVVGRTYRVTAQASIVASDNAGRLQAIHNGVVLFNTENQPTGVGPNDRLCQTASQVFVATATSVVFSFSALSTAILEGGSTFQSTWSLLEELSNQVVTAAYT